MGTAQRIVKRCLKIRHKAQPLKGVKKLFKNKTG